MNIKELRFTIYHMFLLMATLGCQTYDTEDYFEISQASFTKFILGSEAIDQTENTLTIDLDIGALYLGKDVTYLEQSDFILDELPGYQITVESFTKKTLNENNKHSFFIMLDQSDPKDFYDNFNDRLRALRNLFESASNTGNYIALAEYSNDDSNASPVRYYTGNFDNPFDNPIAENLKNAFNLSFNFEGTSPFLESVYIMTSIISSYSKTDEKSLFILSHNRDDGFGNLSFNEVTEYAVANNVKINIVHVDTNPETSYLDSLSMLSSKTGGFLSIIRELNSSLNIMPSVNQYITQGNRIMSKNLHINRLRIRFEGNMEPGTQITGTVSDDLNSNNYLQYYIEIE